MKYNWPKVVDAFRAELAKHVVFYSEDPEDEDKQLVDKDLKFDFIFRVRETDLFHPFGSDRDLCAALGKMPDRCNYRSIKSYWAFKNGKENIGDAIFGMFVEAEEAIREYYEDSWNFPPGFGLPCEIETPSWDDIAEKMIPKLIRAAKT